MEQKKSLTFFPNWDRDDFKYQQLITNTKNYISDVPLSINVTPFLKSLEAGQFSRALRQACGFGLDYLVEILLAYLKQVSPDGSVANFINEPSDSNGQTALHWAASSAPKNKKLSVLKLLLEHQPNPPEIRDKVRDEIRGNEGHLYSDYLDDELKEKLKVSPESQYVNLNWKLV